jgi:AcrR family transcriptional regulator
VGLREEKKRELRERIRETTLALFGQEGFGNTRVADIAAQLRISEATFFNYFPTKHAVLDEALHAAVEAAVTRALARQPETAVDAFRYIAAELAAEFSPERPVGRLVGQHPELISAAVFPGLPPQTLIGFCADLQARGAIRTDIAPSLVSMALLAVLWVACQQAFDGSGPTLDQALQRGVDLFVGGVTPPREGSNTSRSVGTAKQGRVHRR